ncbi:MAG: nickel-responsive transcriptional regulator NikR [Pseudomonadota bacterium]
MEKLKRFSISLDAKLIKEFDTLIGKRGVCNRSKAISELLRNELVEADWRSNREVAGTITIVFDHHKKEMQGKATKVQHDFHKIIISSQHVHLDHNNCLEIIVVKGKSSIVKKLSDELKNLNGVKHHSLTMATTGQSL